MAPATVGMNAMAIWHDAPLAKTVEAAQSVPPDGFWAKAALTVMEATFKAALPKLASVKVESGLVTAMFVPGKVSVGGEKETCRTTLLE